MAPQALASINAIFPEHEKSKALSFYALTFGVASMAGLFLGGALIALNVFGLGWRAIFLINLPVIAIAAPAALVMLRETRSEHARKLDMGGATLLAVALFALISPLIEGREQGWPIWSILMLSASLPLLLLFWRYELRVGAVGGDPIVEPRMLQVPGLTRGLLSSLFFYAFAAFWLTCFGLPTGRPGPHAFRGWSCNPSRGPRVRFGTIREREHPARLREIFCRRRA